jgi:hypothetical protein
VSVSLRCRWAECRQASVSLGSGQAVASAASAVGGYLVKAALASVEHGPGSGPGRDRMIARWRARAPLPVPEFTGFRLPLDVTVLTDR